MKILAVDTSCDETCAAVTEGVEVISNVIWSQASLHAKFGGVMPSLAQRQHRERIDWVVARALKMAGVDSEKIGAVAVTMGPGLAIALEVGIKTAKEWAREFNKPLIAVNHIEGHAVSPLAKSRRAGERERISFPCMALVVSGGHTELIYISKIGRYKVVARTADDALGEALDKAARMLGLGYPGGAILEKVAREGDPKLYPLPLPMAGREDRNEFSYSGLKTAFWRKTYNKSLDRQETANLAASFQNMAFKHLTRVCGRVLSEYQVHDLLVGGGVAANVELRKRLRRMGKVLGAKVRLPYSTRLCTDNAAMIGVAAGFKAERGEYFMGEDIDKIDRIPRWRVDDGD